MKKFTYLFMFECISLKVKYEELTLRFTANNSCTHLKLDSVYFSKFSSIWLINSYSVLKQPFNN